MKTIAYSSFILVILAILFTFVAPMELYHRIGYLWFYGVPIILLIIFTWSFTRYMKMKKLEELASDLEDRLEIEELANQTLAEIRCEELQREILSLAPKGGNQGAFRALILGMNEEQDIPMLELIRYLIVVGELKIHWDVRQLPLYPNELSTSQWDVINEFAERHAKKTN